MLVHDNFFVVIKNCCFLIVLSIGFWESLSFRNSIHRSCISKFSKNKFALKQSQLVNEFKNQQSHGKVLPGTYLCSIDFKGWAMVGLQNPGPDRVKERIKNKGNAPSFLLHLPPKDFGLWKGTNFGIVCQNLILI